MFTTREAIEILRQANPDSDVSEELVRRAIRQGAVTRPPMFAGRLVWSIDHIQLLVHHLGLQVPVCAEVEDRSSPSQAQPSQMMAS
jgi:hypothetical protein